ncbi:MAG TPA: hypothetical protein VGG39_09430 [Polyangiaceae bacterium]|jgi:hypothetical protein
MPSKKKAKKAAKKSKAPAKRAAAKRAAAKGRGVAKRVAKAVARKAPKRAAARRPVAKATVKAKGKAAPARKVASKPARPVSKPAVAVRRRDRAGHIDPKYARELIEKGEPREVDPSSFVERPRSRDDLVEQLGEEFVTDATGAEHRGEDVLDQDVPEELGGPFVESNAASEFAHGTDASNPKSATKEPFPRT